MKIGFGQGIEIQSSIMLRLWLGEQGIKLELLKMDVGFWLMEADGLASHVQDFYVNMFRVDEPCDLSNGL